MSSRRRTEHIFTLANSKTKPWLTLKLFSNAKSSQHMPVFHQGENIEGSVLLISEKIDSVQAVDLLVTGRVTTGPNLADVYTFFDHSSKLWNKAEDDKSSRRRKDYLWPFIIEIPLSVSLPNYPAGFSLPETFAERDTGASIQYELKVHVTRGKWRVDNYLRTGIAYVPEIVPEPMGILRQAAYEQGTGLPGPEIDEDCWSSCEPFILRGSAFNVRDVELNGTLFLAKPLCYTRGSLIPCLLDLESQDQQTLDLLSAHISTAVQLQRRVRYLVAINNKKSAWKKEVHDIKSAVWWPSEPRGSEGTTRRLNGEIHLPNDLKPTSAIAHFTVEYYIVFSPFSAPGFTPSDDKPLTVASVKIATAHAAGVKPKAFCAPSYDTGGPSRDFQLTNVHIPMLGGFHH